MVAVDAQAAGRVAIACWLDRRLDIAALPSFQRGIEVEVRGTLKMLAGSLAWTSSGCAASTGGGLRGAFGVVVSAQLGRLTATVGVACGQADDDVAQLADVARGKGIQPQRLGIPAPGGTVWCALKPRRDGRKCSSEGQKPVETGRRHRQDG